MASDPDPSDITPVSLTMPHEELAPTYDRTLLIESVESLSVALPMDEGAMGESAVSGERAKPLERPVEQTSIRVSDRPAAAPPPASDAVTLDADAEPAAEPSANASGKNLALVVFLSLVVFSICFAASALAVVAILG